MQTDAHTQTLHAIECLMLQRETCTHEFAALWNDLCFCIKFGSYIQVCWKRWKIHRTQAINSFAVKILNFALQDVSSNAIRGRIKTYMFELHVIRCMLLIKWCDQRELEAPLLLHSHVSWWWLVSAAAGRTNQILCRHRDAAASYVSFNISTICLKLATNRDEAVFVIDETGSLSSWPL